MANTLAYQNAATSIAMKGFTVQAPGACTIKLLQL